MYSHSVYQVNLQNQFGGGEVYTRFFSMALMDLGYRVVLFVSRKVDFWDSLLPAGVEIVRVDNSDDILARLPQAKSLIVTQTALDAGAAQSVAQRHVLCGFVHMPLYERDPPGLGHYHLLLPVSQHAQLNLEIFGSGGYASVRDLRASLAPAAKQVRFWGHQANVAAVYRQLDFVLSGLPEKEALGLNLIEAQYCGTPVLAARAPPFTETVIEPETGFFFTDPRQDGGESFARLLQRLLAGGPRPDPRQATAHLARFSVAAFRDRVARALAAAQIVEKNI